MPEAPTAYIQNLLESARIGGHVAKGDGVRLNADGFSGNLSDQTTDVQAMAAAFDALNLRSGAPNQSGNIRVRSVTAASTTSSTATFVVQDVEQVFVVKLTATLGSTGGGNTERTVVYPIVLLRADMSSTSQYYAVDSNNPGSNTFTAGQNIGFSSKIETATVTIDRTGYHDADGAIEFYALAAESTNVDVEAREQAAQALKAEYVQVADLDFVKAGQNYRFASNATNIPASRTAEGYGFMTRGNPSWQVAYLPSLHERWLRKITIGYGAWNATTDATLTNVTAFGTAAINPATPWAVYRVTSATTGHPTGASDAIAASFGGYHVVIRGSDYWWRAYADTAWNHRSSSAHPPPAILGTGVSDLHPGAFFLIPSSARDDLPAGTEKGNAYFATAPTTLPLGGTRTQYLYYYNTVNPPKVRTRTDTPVRAAWEQTEWNVLPVAHGGTGGTTPTQAATNLGIDLTRTGEIPLIANLNHAFADELIRYAANATGRPSDEDGFVVTTKDRQVAITDRDGHIYHRGKREVLATWGSDVNQTKTAISDFATIADQAVAYFDTSTTNVPSGLSFSEGLVGRNGDNRFAVNGINWAWSYNGTDWHRGTPVAQPGPGIRVDRLDRLTGSTVLVRSNDVGVSALLPSEIVDEVVIVSSPADDTRQRIDYYDPTGAGVWRRRERGKTKTWSVWMRALDVDGSNAIWGPRWLQRARRVSQTGNVGSDQYRRRADDRVDIGFSSGATARTEFLALSNEPLLINGLPYIGSGSALSGDRGLLVVAPNLPDADTLGATLSIHRRGTVLSKETADLTYSAAAGQADGSNRPAPGIIHVWLHARATSEPADPQIAIAANGTVSSPQGSVWTYAIPTGTDPLWVAHATFVRDATGEWSTNSGWVKRRDSSATVEYYGAATLAGPFTWSRTRPTVALYGAVLQRDGTRARFDFDGEGRLVTLQTPTTTTGTASATIGGTVDMTDVRYLLFSISPNFEAGYQVERHPAKNIFATTATNATSVVSGVTLVMTWSRDGNCSVADATTTPHIDTNEQGACLMNFVGPTHYGTEVTALHIWNSVGYNSNVAHNLNIDAEW